MIKTMLDIIGKEFPVTEASVGEFRNLSVGPMNFEVSKYIAEGLGAISIMEASGMGGAFSMITFIVNPLHKDAPLFSHDRMNAPDGSDTCFLELYDTTLGGFDVSPITAVAEAAGDELECPVMPNWYDDIRYRENRCKKGTAENKEQFDKLTADFLEAYIAAAKAAPDCDPAEKQPKNEYYSETLLEKGGPAADGFIQTYGKEKTGEFFRTVLFANE